MKMSQKCIVSHCRRTVQLFSSPADSELLKKWKEVLKVDKDEFVVCELHFDGESTETRRTLKAQAIPSVLIMRSDEDCFCQCCCENLNSMQIKVQINIRHKEILHNLLGLQSSGLWICEKCLEIVDAFAEFKREITEKHRLIIKLESPDGFQEIEEIPDQPIMDPFESNFIKEELSRDIESKYEPEIKIDEEAPITRSNLRKTRNASELEGLKFDERAELTSSVIGLDCGNQLRQPVEVHMSPFICDICSRPFKLKNLLLKHIQSHISDRSKHQCVPCSKTFASRNNFLAHNNRYHSKGFHFICDHCENVFSSRKEMTKCRDSHSSKLDSKRARIEETKPCPICNKTMKSNSIHTHIKLIHKRERDQICQVRFLYMNFKDLCNEILASRFAEKISEQVMISTFILGKDLSINSKTVNKILLSLESIPVNDLRFVNRAAKPSSATPSCTNTGKFVTWPAKVSNVRFV